MELFSTSRVSRMYLPARKKEKPRNPFQFERSRNFVIGATGFFFFSVIAAGLLALRRVQERERETTRSLHQRHEGNPRVVIIGAGAGGAALAASLTRRVPQTLVTVIESEKTQVFNGQVPHAHAGHRSYDVNTSGGWDFLRSPTTWNVTREAQLVVGRVVKVDPHEQRVVVTQPPQPSQKNTAAALKPSQLDIKQNGDGGRQSSSAAAAVPEGSSSGGGSNSSLPFFLRWLTPPSTSSSSSSVPRSGDGSYVDPSTGYRIFPYDVLVIASGAQRTLGSIGEGRQAVKIPTRRRGDGGWLSMLLPVPYGKRATGSRSNPTPEEEQEEALKELLYAEGRGCIRESELDRGSIALQPGTTRDLLAHLYKGEVLHVKVPPSSFTGVMNVLLAQQIDKVKKERPEGCPSPAGVFPPNGNDNVVHQKDTEKINRGANFDVHDFEDAAAALWEFQRLQYPTRQDDATFISTTNLLWKFLCYFNKLSRCPLLSVSADAVPIPSSGSDSEWNQEILSFWRARQDWGVQPSALPDLWPPTWRERLAEWRQAASNALGGTGSPVTASIPMPLSPTSPPPFDSDGPRSAEPSASPNRATAAAALRPMHHTYIRSIDTTRREAVLVNYETGDVWRQAYRVLVLDLPMKAGAYIEASGLHRRHYVEEEVLPLLRRWKIQLLAHQRAPSNSSADNDSRGSHTSLVSRQSLVGALEHLSVAQLRHLFRHEASFVDVDPHTLQHRQYHNIFALGDAAGLPTIKSYGATFAQVPVVSHNVQRVLQEQRRGQRVGQQGRRERDLKDRTPPTGLARYAGYTSFHVVMTPWRCMWPAMTYGVQSQHPNHDDATTTSTLLPPPHETHSESADPSIPRTYTSDAALLAPFTDASSLLSLSSSSASWRGAQGTVNGFFCQSAMYELLYFFVFMRGLWYPPKWFAMPSYSPTNGLEVPSSSWIRDLL